MSTSDFATQAIYPVKDESLNRNSILYMESQPRDYDEVLVRACDYGVSRAEIVGDPRELMVAWKEYAEKHGDEVGTASATKAIDLWDSTPAEPTDKMDREFAGLNLADIADPEKEDFIGDFIRDVQINRAHRAVDINGKTPMDYVKRGVDRGIAFAEVLQGWLEYFGAKEVSPSSGTSLQVHRTSAITTLTEFLHCVDNWNGAVLEIKRANKNSEFESKELHVLCQQVTAFLYLSTMAVLHDLKVHKDNAEQAGDEKLKVDDPTLIDIAKIQSRIFALPKKTTRRAYIRSVHKILVELRGDIESSIKCPSCKLNFGSRVMEIARTDFGFDQRHSGGEDGYSRAAAAIDACLGAAERIQYDLLAIEDALENDDEDRDSDTVIH